ncbi:dynamin family protein [Actinomadura macrotermitis]|uniref:Dynamin N-terminal domain-containing protein n=1 Tax=Actinomadura macrotermitis TaxID=2585200 RepID=A0A7K0BQA5_9ACTN|nr:dynamin family protein [Actinomadura macrotermitis]MQY03072.1 hypothetical protein [Actinomadura macrotermitis]
MSDQPAGRRTAGLGSFDERRARLAEMFEATREIALALEREVTGVPGTRHSARLAEAVRTLRRESFRIMVFGDFSSGKSTLVNALLGQELLPMKENPTTAFTTVLRHADQPRAELYEDQVGSGGEPRQVSVGEFLRAVELELDDDDLPGESPYLWGVVYGPYPLLRGSVELIDSAGTNESRRREKVTLAFLPQVDAVIFVTPARGAFKDRDQDHYLRMLQDLGHQEIFFVVNQFDLIREREREDVRRRCRRIAGQYTRRLDRRVFFVSALDALEARLQDPVPPAAEWDSGIRPLEEALSEFLMHDKARIKLLRPAELLVREIVQLHRSIGGRRGMLTRSADELQESLDAGRDKRENILKGLELIRRVLDTWVEETGQLLATEVERFIRELTPRVGEWADDLPKLDVRLLRRDRMARYGDAIQQIDDALNRRLQLELHVFAEGEEGLPAFMHSREAALEQSILPHLHDFADRLEELRGELTGTRDLVDESTVRQLLHDMSVHVPFRVLSRTSPAASWTNAAGVLAVGGAGTAAGAGLISLGLVSWVAAPVVLSAGAVYLVGRRIVKSRLVEQAVTEYASVLTGSAPEIARQYAAECTEGLARWAAGLEQELAGWYGRLVADTEETIRKLRDGRDEAERDRRALDGWAGHLNAIEGDLTDFKQHVLDEMR